MAGKAWNKRQEKLSAQEHNKLPKKESGGMGWEAKKVIAVGSCLAVMLLTLWGEWKSQSPSLTQAKMELQQKREEARKQQEKPVFVNSTSAQTTTTETGKDLVVKSESKPNPNAKAVLVNGTKKKQNSNQKSASQNISESTKASKQNANKNNVVQKSQYKIAKAIEQKTQSNRVVQNAVPLQRVTTSTGDYGVTREQKEEEGKYQYPVEVGYDPVGNYDGEQSEKNIILKETFTVTMATTQENAGNTTQTPMESTTQENVTQEGMPKLEESTTQENTVNIVKENAETASTELDVTDNTEQDVTESSEEVLVSTNAVTTQEEDVKAQEFIFHDVMKMLLPTVPVTEDAKQENLAKTTTQATDRDSTESDGTQEKAVPDEIVKEPKLQETIEKKSVEAVTTEETVSFGKEDIMAPQIAILEDGMKVLQSEKTSILCTNKEEIPIKVKDDFQDAQSSGIQKIGYAFGNRLKYILQDFENAKLYLPAAFYGKVLVNAADQAGNVSQFDTKYILVDKDAPVISWTNGEHCTAPYRLWVDVQETGHIVSGIREVICEVNGEEYNITDLYTAEKTFLSNELNVASKNSFSVMLDEEGDYTVSVKVTDNAGNVTYQNRKLHVDKADLVTVDMPEQFVIHIDPYQTQGKTMIYSDNVELLNQSPCDVKVNIDNIHLKMNTKSTDTGEQKDCDIYLVTPDTKQRIPLQKGNNKQVYSYRLPKNADITQSYLYFEGDIKKGMDALWEDGDITINMQLSFSKWEE